MRFFRRRHRILGLVVAIGIGLLASHAGRREAADLYHHFFPASPGTAEQVAVAAPPTASHPVALLPVGSWAKASVPSQCSKELPHQRAPAFANPKATTQLQVLCYKAMAVGYFQPTRTGLWSAEYLTPQRVRAAWKMKRVDSFHADPRVTDGPGPRDYTHSGYDRGHLSPSGDQPDAASQHDSFAMTNMAPQNPHLNRGPWERLEEAVRNRVVRKGPVYVITGVRFLGGTIGFVHHRIGVPTTYYKMIYDPARGQAIVYEALNRDNGVPRPFALNVWQPKAGENFGLGNVQPLTLHIASGSRYAHE